MRTLVMPGLLAASIAALALACSNDKPAREPSAAQSDPQQAQNPPPSPAVESTASPVKPMDDPTMGADNSDSTFGAGGPQKPFYGPGTTNPDDIGSATTNQGTMQAKQVTTLSDGEIFATLDAANTGEIQMAELARRSAKSAQAKDFATMMITHHSAAEAKLKALGKKDKITGKDGDVSNKLKSDVSGMISDMREKKGADFDRLYIDDQVKAHRDVLDIVDNQLLPSVQNIDLKSHLGDVRQTVADHLAKAQDVQSKMAPIGMNETSPPATKAKGKGKD